MVGLALLALMCACRGQPPAAGASATAPAVQPVAVLGQVINAVLVRDPGAGQFLPATTGSPVSAGSQLQTGAQALARLDFSDGSFVRLAPNSDLGLESSLAEAGASGLRARLYAGKLWAILSDKSLQVYSPAGVIILSGQRASVEYIRGDPGQSSRVTLIVECLEAVCSVQTETARYDLLSGEQIHVSADGSQDARAPLPPSALADFLVVNPELVAPPTSPTVGAVAPSLTAIAPSLTSVAPSVTASPAPTGTPQAATAAPTSPRLSPTDSPAPATPTAPPTDTPAPATPTAPPADTPAPAAPTAPPTEPAASAIPPAGTSGTPLPPGVLGIHVVRAGETVFCIARAYQVLPESIVTANALTDAGALAIGQLLEIPSVIWPSPSIGQNCRAQFSSPFVAGQAGPANATPTSASTLGPRPAATPGVSNIWATPVNLSRSGSAANPALSVDHQGNAYAAWWDQFDGARFMIYQPGAGWSTRMPAPLIVGAAAPSGDKSPTAPSSWRWLADDKGGLHVLWVDATGHLRSANWSGQASGGAWDTPIPLAAHVLNWSAQLVGDTLHVAFVQDDTDGANPPGVYYLRRVAGQWMPPQTLDTSPYFRSLAAGAAHLQLAVNDSGEVDIAWDDPVALNSQFSRSVDNGQNFGDTIALYRADPRIDEQARHLRWLPVSGGFLRQWESGTGCSLYQQQLTSAGGNWSAPVRVLEQLPGCLIDSQIYPLADGRLVLWATVSNSNEPANLVLWNGSRWSQILRADFTFVNPGSHRPAALSCLQTGLAGEQIMVLGCDARGDVWFTISQLSLNDLLPALATEWRPLVALSDPSTNAGLPSAALDGDVVHALWPQDLPGNSDRQRLVGSQGNGQEWSGAAELLRARPDGLMSMPVIVADPRGWMHAVWSSGPNGQLLYSRSHTRDAASAAGWSPPLALPVRQDSGGWPAMILEPDGRLVVVDSVPFNEGRGLYQLESSDAGQTWTQARVILDAAAAGWATLQDSQLTLDTAGRLHLVVVRGSLPPATAPVGVYYLRSEDGGQTWSVPESVGEAGAGFPRLAPTARGELFRLWVQPSTTRQPLWQQSSQDGGKTWSVPALVPGLQNIAPNFGLASDGQGALFLVAIQIQADRTAALMYLRWDGQKWVDQQNFSLGYTADDASGATAIFLPSHRLGVFYRVTTSVSPGTGPYIIGYTERVVAGADLPALPALTPTAPPADTATAPPPPTLTAIPTLDAGSLQTATTFPTDKWKLISAITAAMLLVALVAIWRLSPRRR